MPVNYQVERWIERFPLIKGFSAAHLQIARGTVHFPILEAGAVAYELDGACANYLMCIDGRTRVFRMSEGGREVLIYKVGAGGTCVLTTQCLLAGGGFPAASIAEERTELAAIPASTFQQLMAESPEFRSFVLDDYSRLMASMFTLIEEVAFAPLEQRLARRLLTEAGPDGVVHKTHQQLAADVGSVREVVSRILAQWAEAGLVILRRGQVELADRAALASNRLH
ncbi:MULTISPECIES: Crp/Fnr family transcriptional regulator [Methylobacteriaceae]|uniref:CRP/FNR family transcriptional regulator n=1 Tax=Methylorubrum thiocyanatum TaxID=47958 RepID=A0AA40VDB6_9HYPH|nr:Crp/Fnr family transcriptional regulator [Methylorubrum thiocyanatum]AWI88417.1 Crp/Fnr family transcriptional regulator [Methylobacterium sp. DM1]MBA8915015.1 CRP/FNR family transcriptional regulator [Methylorubrum thiocyanatum]GJE79422.1 Cyclic AMP receptor protein [Methylorubrum thiocyanatum]